MGMHTFGSATSNGIMIEQVVRPRCALVAPGPPDDGSVLTWSGPGGWRSVPPVLVPRTSVGGSDLDAGFTTIELMVALLVMVILLAVALPAFLGSTHAADDRTAQSNLFTALTDARTQFQSGGQTYFVNGTQDPVALANLLGTSQPSLTFRAGSLGPATSQGSSGSLSSISLAVSSDGGGLVLAAFSVPGDCFYVVDNAGALSPAAAATAPYHGTSTVTTMPTAALVGSIGLPTGPGTSFVDVKGDLARTDCNAFTPKTSGPPATVQYLTSEFPS